MTEYLYTEKDRITQLTTLTNALKELIPVATQFDLLQSDDYKNALDKAEALLRNGFNKNDLKELSESIPDVFPRHKDWESSYLKQKEDGTWYMPDWVTELKNKLEPVLAAAEALIIVGYY